MVTALLFAVYTVLKTVILTIARLIKYTLILIGYAAFAAVWIASMPVWLPIRIARRRKGG